MKFFLDTANLDEIREAIDMGVIDGITTNPSLVAKEGNIDFKKHVVQICELVNGPVSVEVTSLDAEGMIREGQEFVKLAPNVVVKCPLTRDGLKATRVLYEQGSKINVTLCFSASQAILAAKAGATYISPFVGRLDDIGANGMHLIREIVEIYRNYEWKTEVLVASVRNPLHVIEAARMGAHVSTIPFKIIDQLLKHPLTDKGLDQFLADWRKSGRS